MEQTLGKRIMENRKRMGMTQDALAERLGITAQAVSKWENDQSCPDITMLPRLCDIFGITTDELLGRERAKTVHEAEVVTDGPSDGIHVESDGGKWEFHWDSGRRGAVAFAVLVIWVGALSVVTRLLSWEVSFWDILWPSALLVFGIAGLFHKFSFLNIGMTLFGSYFLVDHLNILELGIGNELLFPIAVVLFGLSLLADALKKPKKSKFRVTHNDKEKETYSAFQVDDRHFDCNLSFGDQRYLIESEQLESGKASVSFGAMVVDLTACPQVAEDCHIEASCSFGELILIVPRRFRVEPTVGSAFANIECNGHADAQPEGVIRLDGSVSFGEIQVQYI